MGGAHLFLGGWERGRRGRSEQGREQVGEHELGAAPTKPIVRLPPGRPDAACCASALCAIHGGCRRGAMPAAPHAGSPTEALLPPPPPAPGATPCRTCPPCCSPGAESWAVLSHMPAPPHRHACPVQGLSHSMIMGQVRMCACVCICAFVHVHVCMRVSPHLLCSIAIGACRTSNGALRSWRRSRRPRCTR